MKDRHCALISIYLLWFLQRSQVVSPPTPDVSFSWRTLCFFQVFNFERQEIQNELLFVGKPKKSLSFTCDLSIGPFSKHVRLNRLSPALRFVIHSGVFFLINFFSENLPSKHWNDSLSFVFSDGFSEDISIFNWLFWSFCQEFAKNEEVTLMTPENISIVFGPTVWFFHFHTLLWQWLLTIFYFQCFRNPDTNLTVAEQVGKKKRNWVTHSLYYFFCLIVLSPHYPYPDGRRHSSCGNVFAVFSELWRPLAPAHFLSSHGEDFGGENLCWRLDWRWSQSHSEDFWCWERRHGCAAAAVKTVEGYTSWRYKISWGLQDANIIIFYRCTIVDCLPQIIGAEKLAVADDVIPYNLLKKESDLAFVIDGGGWSWL